MPDSTPKSSLITAGPLLGGLAALLMAGVTIYEKFLKDDIPKREVHAVSLESFDALPALVAPGEAAVLRWRSEYAETCNLEPGIGAVGLNGSRSVKPGADTTYTLRCVGAEGEVERSVSLSVVAIEERPKQEVQPEPEPAPRVARQRPAQLQTVRDEPSNGSDARARALLEEARQLQESLEVRQRLLEEAEATYAPAPAYHCCDMTGMQRCPLVSPVQVGSPCFCPFQGTGLSCP
jgi:hypothetical protein